MITLGNDITINPNIELLSPQTHKNITVIPLKTERTYIDILTLKKGLELGLVKVSECPQSQVNTLVVTNASVTPLILIDGEEIVGGDQNRIVNSTVVIDARSKMKISVSCTEKNRWAYKSEFKQSDYMANHRTRVAKEYASRDSEHFQNVIWSSIDMLEHENSFSSPTAAMEESYENLKINHDKIIKEFDIVKDQNGIIVIIDGKIEGFELFLSSEIYKEFHEKILKSYLIDAEINENQYPVNIDAAQDALDKAYDSSFTEKETKGLEKAYTFENQDGLGTLYAYNDKIIHWSYFKKMEEIIKDEIIENTALESDI